MTNAIPIDVSVIIVNWNTIDLLRACIASVFNATRSINFEVIVIDNASADGSVEMVRQEFGKAIVIANAKNVGFAAANNQGMAIATGRYVLLLNSDTIVLDGAIEKTIAYADRWPDTAALGCRILNPDRSLQNSCFMFPSLLNLLLFSTYLYRLFPRSRFFGREQMTWWDRDDAREVDVVTGCYMLVRKQAIDEVGMMDSGFFMYAEETDWCYRFKSKGWKNRFTPDAEIVHLGGASAAKLGSRRAANHQCLIHSLYEQALVKGSRVGWHMSDSAVLRDPVGSVVAQARDRLERAGSKNARKSLDGTEGHTHPGRAAADPKANPVTGLHRWR